jgi:hypothetical protein
MSTDADTTCLRDAASGATDDVCISTVGDVAAFKQGDGVTAGGITAGTVVSTSRMTFSSGSAAVPGLTFAADTNNNSGLYGAGENILGISTGGTLRMLISASDIGLANDTTLSKSIDNKNAKTVVTGGSGDVTCAGGGSATLTLANAFPVGVVKLGVSTRVTTALTGSTGYTVGDTGATDPDMYGVATTATQGTTTSPASQTVSSLGTQITAAGDVVITFVGGACTAGVIRVAAHYLLISAPISN